MALVAIGKKWIPDLSYACFGLLDWAQVTFAAKRWIRQWWWSQYRWWSEKRHWNDSKSTPCQSCDYVWFTRLNEPRYATPYLILERQSRWKKMDTRWRRRIWVCGFDASKQSESVWATHEEGRWRMWMNCGTSWGMKLLLYFLILFHGVYLFCVFGIKGKMLFFLFTIFGMSQIALEMLTEGVWHEM